MPKLTKRLLDSLAPESHDRFVWDGALAGFGLRVRPTGRKTFLVQYRTGDGRQRRRVIGQFPMMTVEEAWVLARGWLLSAQRGKEDGRGTVA